MSEKTALEEFDELLGFFKKKQQMKISLIFGVFFVLSIIFTGSLFSMLAALGFFSFSFIRYCQVKNLSKSIDLEDTYELKIKPVVYVPENKNAFSPSAIVDSMAIPLEKEIATLSYQYRDDDEGDDILICISHSFNSYIHPAIFFEYIKGKECEYLYSQDEEFIKYLALSPCFKCTYLEDSRYYPSIYVDGSEMRVFCKYLCPIFYIIVFEEKIYLVVDGLVNTDVEEIPPLIKELDEFVFYKSSAEFDEEDEAWALI